MPPVKPMLAKAVTTIPEGNFAYEPKWDGFRAIVFRDGNEVALTSRNTKPLTRYFPELMKPIKASLPKKVVLDGEIIVRRQDALGFDDLQQRIHPAESRIERLAEETPAELVFFDALAVGKSNLLETPFEKRREHLVKLSSKLAPALHLEPSTLDPTIAKDWHKRFEGAGLDGLIAKPLDGIYEQNKRTQLKIKHTRTLDVVVAGYRMHTDGAGVGSLVVGLYDADQRLHHCGVVTSFTAAKRVALVDELAPYVLTDDSTHPWADWMNPAAHTTGQVLPGTPNRWSGQRDSAPMVPLRIELVAEVKYEAMLNGRFRGVARFVRWRDDRDPASCGFDQVEVPTPIGLSEVLSAVG